MEKAFKDAKTGAVPPQLVAMFKPTRDKYDNGAGLRAQSRAGSVQRQDVRAGAAAVAGAGQLQRSHGDRE